MIHFTASATLSHKVMANWTLNRTTIQAGSIALVSFVGGSLLMVPGQ